eukprot:GHVN01076725.1.p1 GENE.GHVN01076725.1~~GHVN01076725.1.p1  ORF type:complete len:686 (+),score=118.42 GHVN01076725.1:83-2140(+)
MCVTVNTTPLSGIYSLFEENLLTDFAVMPSDGPPVRCHRLVVAGASPTVREILTWQRLSPALSKTHSSPDSTSLHNTSHSVVKAIIESMYSGKFICKPSEISEAISAADFLQMNVLRDELATAAFKAALEPKDMVALFFAVTQHELTTSLPIHRLIGKVLPTVSTSPDFLALEASAIYNLIGCVPDRLLEAVVRWISHKIEDRYEEGEGLLSRLDLDACSPHCLAQAMETLTSSVKSLPVSSSQSNQNAILRCLLNFTSRLHNASLSIHNRERILPQTEDHNLSVMVGKLKSESIIQVSGGLRLCPLLSEHKPHSTCAVPGGVFMLHTKGKHENGLRGWSGTGGLGGYWWEVRIYSFKETSITDEVIWDGVKFELRDDLSPSQSLLQCVYCEGVVFIFESLTQMKQKGSVAVFHIETGTWSRRDITGLESLDLDHFSERVVYYCGGGDTIYGFIKPNLFLSFDVLSSTWSKMISPSSTKVSYHGRRDLFFVGESLHLVDMEGLHYYEKGEVEQRKWKSIPSPFGLASAEDEFVACPHSSETLVAMYPANTSRHVSMIGSDDHGYHHEYQVNIFNTRLQCWRNSMINLPLGTQVYNLLSVNVKDNRLSEKIASWQVEVTAIESENRQGQPIDRTEPQHVEWDTPPTPRTPPTPYITNFIGELTESQEPIHFDEYYDGDEDRWTRRS